MMDEQLFALAVHLAQPHINVHGMPPQGRDSVNNAGNVVMGYYSFLKATAERIRRDEDSAKFSRAV